jgi:methionyl-tRNA synthetase
MTKPIYLTSPLYYVNSKPHIGHAYTTILCDVFTRFHRFQTGNAHDAFFLTGTDEHGEKIAKAAKEKNMEPKAFVDSIVPSFKSLWQNLGIEYDGFIRTTDPEHKLYVQQVLAELFKKGDIYKGEYKGWYCTPCESFWTSLQLVNNHCPDCQRPVSEIKEENYFFKLTAYQSWLIEYIQKNKEFIYPETKKNEVLGFLNNNTLEDLCITRLKERLSWGIPFPIDDKYVVYVWFDALVNYVSATQYIKNKAGVLPRWPADIHFIGKDILRQHAVYWPIMLKAMGLEMPRTILAHGWWTIEGAKMSKSRGNIVDPVELVQKYGKDTLRYYLLSSTTLGSDGAYSEDLLAQKYTMDLANDLGNLVHRSLAMLKKYYEGNIPSSKSTDQKECLALAGQVAQAMKKNSPQSALDLIWQQIRRLNQFVEEKKPWTMAKKEESRQELADFMFLLLDDLRIIAIVLSPFLPETSSKMLTLLGWSKTPAPLDTETRSSKVGQNLQPGAPLFPRLEDEEEEKK